MTAEFFEIAAANFILEPGAELSSKGRGHVVDGQGGGQTVGAGAGHASRGGNGRLSHCISNYAVYTCTCRRPGVVAMLLYPGPIVSVKLGIEQSSNCAVIAIDFASRYCFSCWNSANTRPNLKTDTRLVGITE